MLGNNMAVCRNNMALFGNNMPLSDGMKILQILMKKVAEIFGRLKNILYLCNVIKELITRRDEATRCSWPDEFLIP